jgi:nucleoside phosphorylase
MGWTQGLPRPGLADVMDAVPLHVPPPALTSALSIFGAQFPALSAQPAVVEGELLSVAAASASRYEAGQRARAYPDALAEEMEAFAVALAARLAGVPLTVIRGVSNVAGDRNATHWRIPDALAAVRAVLEQVLAR